MLVSIDWKYKVLSGANPTSLIEQWSAGLIRVGVGWWDTRCLRS